MSDTEDFVEGIRKLGKGNELLALRCLKKAAAEAYFVRGKCNYMDFG